MQLKDVTPIIKAILDERNKIPLMINTERYIPNWQPNLNGNAMRGGIRKALRAIEQAPVVDAKPVVHGRWVLGVPITCSLCGKPAAQHDLPNSFWMSPYCPWCGQPMDATDTNTSGKPESCRYYTKDSYWGDGCLGTKEIDRCEGEGCKRWKPKQDGGAE